MFNILVEPGCGYNLDEVQHNGWYMLPYQFSYDENVYILDSSWSHISEQQIYDLGKKGNSKFSYNRPPLGEWIKAVSSCGNNDLLYIAFSQKVTNSIASIELIKKLLHRENIQCIDTHLIDNRLLLQDLKKQSLKSIQEGYQYIKDNRKYYYNFWFPYSADNMSKTNRGEYEELSQTKYNALYCTPEGLLTSYPIKYTSKESAMLAILDLYKKATFVDISYSCDENPYYKQLVENFCRKNQLQYKIRNVTPLIAVGMNRETVGLTFRV